MNTDGTVETTGERADDRGTPVGSLVAAFAVFASAIWSSPYYLIDDAYISFRYARNLAQGHGLVFNPGEYVEGYTSFLWVLILSVLEALGRNLAIWAPLLGVAASVAAIWGTLRLFVVVAGRRNAFFAPVLLAAVTPFVFWTRSGMEATLASALLVWGVERACVGRPALGGALLGGAVLTRPEAILGVAVVALLQRDSRCAARLAVGSALVVLPWLAWKLWYYGTLLPNTFHAKVGATTAQLARGLRYVGNFGIHATGWGLVPGAILSLPRRRPEESVLWALVAVGAAATVAVGGDSFLFHRFLVPWLPFWAVLAGLGLARLADAMPRLPARLLLLAFVVSAIGTPHLGHYRETIAEKSAINARYAAIGRWLREHSRPQESIAVIAGGIIPWEARRPAIDMLGLTDATIGKRLMPAMGSGMAGHEKGDGAYVLSRNPRFILIHPITRPHPEEKRFFAAHAGTYVSTQELWGSSEFHQRYQLRVVPLDGFHFHVFERKRPKTIR